MQLLRHPKELVPSGRPVCLAIGMFDGVHLGHQQVIRQAMADAVRHEALSIAVTFDCHPGTVIAPHRVPPLIHTLSQKLRVIESLGIDAIDLIHFDRTFSRIPAEIFIRTLAADFGRIHSICVGNRFSFGHKRSGNVSVLQQLGKELHFEVHGLAAVALDEKIVSSTRIRETIQHGNLDAASQMLGRPYSLAGSVISGDRVGRTLGFPTANIDVAGLALPPCGVYAAHARFNGQSHRAVINIGHRPTLKSPQHPIQVEAHLLNFSDDIYGKELELVFTGKIRPEEKFSSPEALRKQIAGDIAAARKIFE
jgi:riboflavin kinase / FMN adenylyltransferase